MAFVRQSKFRHVHADNVKSDKTLTLAKAVTKCAFEGNFIEANGKYITFCTDMATSGTFFVLPNTEVGRMTPDQHKITGHKDYVLDMRWDPFDENILATCAEDGSIRIWEIPEGGINDATGTWSYLDDDQKFVWEATYHQKRCVQISWHPIVKNVLMSVSQEPKIVIWDMDEGSVEVEIVNHPDTIYCANWNQKGDKIVTSCKDKKFRILEARSGEILKEFDGHEGIKATRVIFTMNDKYLFSCGFDKKSVRQFSVWSADPAGTSDALEEGELDTANGVLYPYYDPDTELLYLAAKGDSVIRYYELEDKEPYCHYISTFTSNSGQRGLGAIAKRDCDVNVNEIFKFFKLSSKDGKGAVEPVSFQVTRKSDLFQDDIYPDAVSGEPAIQPADDEEQMSAQWFSGENFEPKRIKMSTKFKGAAPTASGGGGGLKKGGLKKGGAKKEGEVRAPKVVTAPCPDKPKEEVKAKETPKPKEEVKLRETPKPKEEVKPKEEPKPKEEVKLRETPKPKEEPKAKEPEPVASPEPVKPSAVKSAEKRASKVETKDVDAMDVQELRALVKDLQARDKKREDECGSLSERMAKIEQGMQK